ncbi:hypothetical protein KO561_05240 [Radiobacillus kanasensis]|uniref:hypothetical protein n=1 Tax=Radiobacillus kanasensis TaxID=2844358 RepID=UPI001E61B283|nr:hypothetical protein [Radiobacillus kanasensis]UFU00355.1 hypothetical protein KO561_05240 [Radiobacillus kanasensis]
MDLIITIVYLFIGMICVTTFRLPEEPDGYHKDIFVCILIFILFVWPVYILLRIARWYRENGL